MRNTIKSNRKYRLYILLYLMRNNLINFYYILIDSDSGKSFLIFFSHCWDEEARSMRVISYIWRYEYLVSLWVRFLVDTPDHSIISIMPYPSSREDDFLSFTWEVCTYLWSLFPPRIFIVLESSIIFFHEFSLLKLSLIYAYQYLIIHRWYDLITYFCYFLHAPYLVHSSDIKPIYLLS